MLASRPLIDGLGRRVTYLRVSVTDRCDLRCAYCLTERMAFAGGGRGANGDREAYVRAAKLPGTQAIMPLLDEDSSLMSVLVSVLANANALIRRNMGMPAASEAERVDYMSWTP